MSADPVFTVGQHVVATGSYMHSLTEGKEYTVLAYDEPVVTPSFTFPAYVTVMGDLGKPVTGHTHRFKELAMMLHFKVRRDGAKRVLYREYRSAWGWGWEPVRVLGWA